jgi:hypothetical protein
LPQDDLAIILTRLGLIENITQIIPKIINNIETSTVMNEHSQAEKYLDKAFDVLQHIIQANSQEVKLRFASEKVIKEGFDKMIRATISDPSPVTLNIIKRYIKLIQILTLSPNLFDVRSLKVSFVISAFGEI